MTIRRSLSLSSAFPSSPRGLASCCLAFQPSPSPVAGTSSASKSSLHERELEANLCLLEQLLFLRCLLAALACALLFDGLLSDSTEGGLLSCRLRRVLASWYDFARCRDFFALSTCGHGLVNITVKEAD